jgi:tripartite ATP-independent transporter DctP family solute receptor
VVVGLSAAVVLWTAQGAGAQQKIEMRIATVAVRPAAIYIGIDHFQKRVEELTNGRVKVTDYEASLGRGERQLYEAVLLGTLEGTIITTGPLSGFVPEADLFNLPFLFNDSEHAYKVVDGEIGAWINEKVIPKGLRILGWWTNGIRNTSNRIRPIYKPEDYKGLKIRTMESPPFIALYKAMGAIPVPMAITEVYTALSQGTIDGIDGSLAAQLEFKHIEVLKYGAVTDHVVLLFPFSVNEKWWQGLPADIRQAIQTAEAEARPLQRKAEAEYDKQIENEWIKRGKVITHPDIKPFQQIAESIYPQFYDKVGGKERIDLIRKIGEGMK